MILGMCFSVPEQVNAAESDEVYVDGSYLTEEEESSVIIYPMMRGVYLSQGTGTITSSGNQTVSCYGSTTANTVVSKVYVGISLQYYNTSTETWVTVATASDTEYDAYYAYISKTYTVTGGYYYRVKTQHWAASDYATGITSGIWIAK